MKRGFTLIEMAIVLVVIGLIVGMAMKGTTLIESALMKAEINKINRILSAVSTYYSKNNSLPGEVVSKDSTAKQFSPLAIFEDLVLTGHLEESDLVVNSLNGYWSFIGCGATERNNTGIDELQPAWIVGSVATSPYLCMYLSKDNPKFDNVPHNSVNQPSNSNRFICYIETMIDDKDITTGSGRQNFKKQININNYHKCNEESDTTNVEYIFQVY